MLARDGPAHSVSLAAGDGLTAVVLDGVLWRIEMEHAHRIGRRGCTRIVGVAGDRIAVETKTGGADVLAPNGRRLARFTFGKSGGPALLSPTGLFAKTRTSIDVYDVGAKAAPRSIPIAAGGTSWDVLAARERYLVYAIGIVLHVHDLRTGREGVVGIPAAAGPIGAAFGRDGLFVSYTRAYSGRPGRISFVPWRLLPGPR